MRIYKFKNLFNNYFYPKLFTISFSKISKSLISMFLALDLIFSYFEMALVDYLCQKQEALEIFYHLRFFFGSYFQCLATVRYNVIG